MLFRSEAIAGDGARVAIIAALLAPVGAALGGPFPVLLARESAPAERIAGLWAVNGAAGVAGGTVAVLALRVAGTTATLLIGAGLYLATALVAPPAPDV